ncbi:MAG: tRNA (adenosine(37)-N6)-dimethylallyltransferase MiaA [Oscillospiraceae bacterium]|nr:tRNA (adenosine(37)-N6)-dimethylallyltransferase MiaA [Oscillospiraceae bacterium]
MNSEFRIIVVCGPTASGKTSLAVRIAAEFDGEVVSADSMQIYKGMDIATAKPTADELSKVPHHLIGFAEPEAAFSVADYLKAARAKIADIALRGKLPIIAGGTGLYISCLVDNITFDDTGADYEFREELRQFAEKQGNRALLEQLREKDPETASKLHENNLSRIIRAIEVQKMSGKAMSEHKLLSRAVPSPYAPLLIGLDYSPRALLYERINSRVDEMLKTGLVEEARAFLRMKLPTAAQAIGHKELKPYIDGTAPLSECVENLKQSTRRYAKRQLTWLRRDKRINWLISDNNTNFNEIYEKTKKIIKNTKNLW